MKFAFCLLIFSVVLVCSAQKTRCRRRKGSGGQCGPGQYLDKSKSSLDPSCEPCPINTFMDQDKHECERCIDCSSYTPRYKENHLIVVAKCTPTNDTKFECQKGYHEASTSELHQHDDWPRCVEDTTPEPAITATSVTPDAIPDTQKSMPSYATTVDPWIHAETSDGPKETWQFNSTDIPAESSAADNENRAVFVVVGVICGGLIIAVLVYCIVKKRRKLRETCLQVWENMKRNQSKREYTDVVQNDTDMRLRLQTEGQPA